MPIVNVKAPDGSTIKVNAPEGASDDDILEFAQIEYSTRKPQVDSESPENDTSRNIDEDQDNREVLKKKLGAFGNPDAMAELVGSISTGAVAEILAGLSGIAQTINPFSDEGSGKEAVQSTREALTYLPKMQEAKQTAGQIGDVLSPVAEKLQSVEEGMGESTLSATGSPILATVAHTIPTALLELSGLAISKGAAKSVEKIKNIAKASPDGLQTSILEAGLKNNVPVMTSDLFPPESYMGKIAQSFSEKLGPLGTGGARNKQQIARTEAIIGLADEFGVDLDTDFAASVANSIRTQNAKRLELAGMQRRQAINDIDKFGKFENKKTIDVINDLLNKQESLGATANKTIIKELEDFKNELSKPTTFSEAAAQRTQLIKKKLQYARGEDLAPVGILQEVKSALDKDMIAFSRKVDKNATHNWLDANRKFAQEADISKRTTLKQILESGDVTPEKILPQLKGGRPSELNRLYDNLSEKGRSSARGALIQQALKDAKFFEVDANPNPNAVLSAMNRSNFQQAANVFFKGRDKVELDGLIRLLNATKQAQSSQSLLRTGEMAAITGGYAGLGTSAAINPLTTIPIAVAASAAIKAYESKAFRNLMIRLKNAPAGSSKELKIIDAALPLVITQIKEDEQ